MNKPVWATLVLAAAVAGCSSTPKNPAVPAALQVPPDQELFLETQASGVQIYECAPKQSQPSAYEWAFRAPEAKLTGRFSGDLGKHYAGPTWEAPDGSRVLGEVKGRDAGPDATAIPWLLLNAKAVFGKGVFTQTRSIQRVKTQGGLVPTEPCTAANATQFARVPYTATYYFYKQR